MQYFTIDEKIGKYIEYDETTDKARVFIKKDLEKQVTEAQVKLASIPDSIDDKELLEWAKVNHPQNMDYSKEQEVLQKLISANEAVISAIGGK